ncbi:hypothetical protein AKJ40_04515 [candidate division MSBL1 archaeon SCGC-AAA259M10]|uniref:Branched-chain amino acid ABC transporter permease n=1 Tax=candidate division MSBL1 archaeon SCGC-AAA259M10 TaxID=1698270 RepID=A0A133UX12_9EURY|nr:hypothetical protein AKJ40_04515 [candidate division MSBL1 archaeon SCGC-AAA259M10]
MIVAKLRSIYFAILTLAFGEIVVGIIYYFKNLTGGSLGLYVTLPKILQTSPNYYYFVLLVSLIAIFIYYRIANSPFGLIIQTIRDNDRRIESLGINVYRYKIINFTISGVLAGLGGLLYVYNVGMAFPTLANWQTSGHPIIASLLGGTGTYFGPFLGMIIYETVRTSALIITQRWMIIVGLLLVLVILFMPEGILGFLERKFRE